MYNNTILNSSNSAYQTIVNQYKGLVSDNGCLLLTGSHSVNLDNPKSDIDLIIVTTHKIPDVNYNSYMVDYIDGFRVESLVITPDNFTSNLLQIKNSGFGHDMLAAYKFVYSIALINSDNYINLLDDFCWVTFKYKKKKYHQDAFIKIYEDVIGSLTLVDVYSTISWSKSLLLQVMEIYLISNNDFYDKLKFNHLRVNNRFLDLNRDFISSYNDLILGGCKPSEFTTYLTEIFLFVKTILILDTLELNIEHATKVYNIILANQHKDYKKNISVIFKHNDKYLFSSVERNFLTNKSNAISHLIYGKGNPKFDISELLNLQIKNPILL
ncbi:hypothetical protein RJY19_004624 [Vibrio alginolyticus]|nr:hypothetical protein [Vibrio alginolyticus]